MTDREAVARCYEFRAWIEREFRAAAERKRIQQRARTPLTADERDRDRFYARDCHAHQYFPPYVLAVMLGDGGRYEDGATHASRTGPQTFLSGLLRGVGRLRRRLRRARARMRLRQLRRTGGEK
jgi:hypothetical protein